MSLSVVSSRVGVPPLDEVLFPDAGFEAVLGLPFSAQRCSHRHETQHMQMLHHHLVRASALKKQRVQNPMIKDDHRCMQYRMPHLHTQRRRSLTILNTRDSCFTQSRVPQLNLQQDVTTVFRSYLLLPLPVFGPFLSSMTIFFNLYGGQGVSSDNIATQAA